MIKLYIYYFFVFFFHLNHEKTFSRGDIDSAFHFLRYISKVLPSNIFDKLAVQWKSQLKLAPDFVSKGRKDLSSHKAILNNQNIYFTVNIHDIGN